MKEQEVQRFEKDTYMKTVIDLVSMQYEQFSDSVKRLIDSNDKAAAANDKAHDLLFQKIDSVTTDIHEINSNVKIIANNQETQQKEVENIKETVNTLSDRVDEVEKEQEHSKHFREKVLWYLGAAAVVLAIIGGILKLFHIF